jgi:hypothetical protein
VEALRRCGAKVFPLHQVGGGCPDLLVAINQERTFLLEVKMPGEKINKLQAEWLAAWPGEVHVVRTPDEALRVLLGKAMD